MALMHIAQTWFRLHIAKVHLWWVQKTNPSRRHSTILGCINPAEVRLLAAVRWNEGVMCNLLRNPRVWTPPYIAMREEEEDAAYDAIMDRLELPYPQPIHVKMTDEEADEALRRVCAMVKAGRI